MHERGEWMDERNADREGDGMPGVYVSNWRDESELDCSSGVSSRDLSAFNLVLIEKNASHPCYRANTFISLHISYDNTIAPAQ